MTPEEKKAYHKAYYEKNRERLRRSNKENYEKNKDRHRRTNAEWTRRNAESVRAYKKAWKDTPQNRRKDYVHKLRTRYRITPEEYDNMALASCGRCAACGGQDDGTRSGGLVVDHCHTSGRVRGLICHNCNMAVGHLKEDPARAMAVFDYLKLECYLEDD